MKSLIWVVAMLAACGPSSRPNGGDDDGTGDGGNHPGDGQQPCAGNSCSTSCQAAADNHSSIGCDYYAVDMDGQGPAADACFTAFVANVSMSPVHIDVSWGTQAIAINTFAKLPVGTGQSITYAPYDNAVGLQPGQVAILFLAQGPSSIFNMNVTCPVPAAVGDPAQINGSGVNQAFHITTDQPVVAYQMLPYGGGKAAVTGASLLIPTTAWGTNYIAVTAYDSDAATPPISIAMGPSLNFVAMEDGTTVTMRPKSKIAAAGPIPAADANGTWSMTLAKGQYAQITQLDPLSGSPVTSNKPIGVFGGSQYMAIDRCCDDHGEQMNTPIQSLGHEYVAAPHGDRHRDGSADPRIFRVFGAVDGTQLTYDPPTVSGPATINATEWKEIRVPDKGGFSVKSQDEDHPFAFYTYMSGGGGDQDNPGPGEGDADVVRLGPPQQWLTHYVFYTDPTYPFTTLTVVRQKRNGAFDDVTLDCLGTITGWAPVGTGGQYEMAFLKLADAFNAVGNCNNGVHTMNSNGQFGVWVWGWGADYVKLGSGLMNSTGWVSYGYPAGEAVLPINTVVLQ